MRSKKSGIAKAITTLAVIGTFITSFNTPAFAGNQGSNQHRWDMGVHSVGGQQPQHRRGKHGGRHKAPDHYGTPHPRGGHHRGGYQYGPPSANLHPGGRRGHGRHGQYRNKPHHSVCGPRRAMNKAYRMGLNNPQVHRIKERRIAVVGYQHGYRTKMVFSRYSNCHLIKTVNFGW